MDWLAAFRTFLRVAELESFSAAAEQLGIARSLASRRIRDLETALGAPLLLRSTRRVRLTEAGNLLRAKLSPLLEQLDGLIAEASARQTGIAGLLRLSCPTSFGIRFLAPALAEFMQLHPQLRVELILNDRAVDPVEEGFDLVLSDAERISGQYREEPLAQIELVCVASPEYLRRRGEPDRPEALKRHAIIHYLHAGTGHDWLFSARAGAKKSPSIPSPPPTTAASCASSPCEGSVSPSCRASFAARTSNEAASRPCFRIGGCRRRGFER